MATVLLVDDNDDFRYIFRALLVHHGYSVHEAADGAAGIRMARDVRPDVIVLDLAMPVMSGLDALVALKGDIATSSIPVLLLTAMEPPTTADTGLGNGFYACLTKPVDLSVFLSILAELSAAGQETCVPLELTPDPVC